MLHVASSQSEEAVITIRPTEISTALLVHNHYREPGGEDRVFESECRLLERAGINVLRYEVHNEHVDILSPITLAAKSVWNRTTYRAVSELLESTPCDVVHVHNTLPIASASVFVAARRAGSAVVQTLHNYRMVCPSATLFRDGHTCELCVSQPLALSGIRHACYRHSRPATAVVAASTFIHRTIGTYAQNIDRFIALTNFAREKLIEGGIAAHQVVVKPNFTEPESRHRGNARDGALFVGRLTEGKGVRTLLDAWQRNPDLPPLRIAGDGPLRPLAESVSVSNKNVTVLGPLSQTAVREEMCGAALLVFPSLWFEGFPMTIVEAFSLRVPVVASRIGSVAEIVTDGECGLTFTPGDAVGLADAVRRLISDPDLNQALGDGALRRYESRYTPEANLEQLLRIYGDAIERRARRPIQLSH